MENQENKILQDIHEKVNHGFYIDNLKYMAEQFLKLSLSNGWSSTCFLMNQIFLYLAQVCDVHPLPTQIVLRIEKQMKTSVLALLDDLDSHPTVEQIKSDSDQIVKKLLDLNL